MSSPGEADPHPPGGEVRIAASPASFRDPSGSVHVRGERVFRTVMPRAAADFEFVRGTGLLEPLIRAGKVVEERIADPAELGDAAAGAYRVLEHPKLAMVSYPYEWPFAALKSAALLHLELHLESLAHGVNLSDASAYNIQFRGARPVFIDLLSFRRYREGEYWLGHRQFCEQFLNPLLLRALRDVPFQAWYRGAQEGVTAGELARVLGWRDKLSLRVLTHVTLQARFQAGATARAEAQQRLRTRPLALSAFRYMLGGLQRWIAGLAPPRAGRTTWSDYTSHTSYSAYEMAAKRAFVAEFVAATRPRMIWDLGCNTGDFSALALDAGAGLAVGFEGDHGALELAFERAVGKNLNFLPLYLDACNPSPAQGFAQAERMGLQQRARPDALLALALLHHLAIGRNVPLDRLLDWLLALAPQGVIEFVPKADPMVQRLLTLREDVFEGYGEHEFRDLLAARATIERELAVSKSGRRLFWYRRVG